MTLRDVAPTLLHLLDVPVPRQMHGVSHAPVLRGDTSEPLRDCVLASVWSSEAQEYHSQTLYTANRRISLFPFQNTGEFYDLETDPHELTNLFDCRDRCAERDRLLARLEREAGPVEAREVKAICPW